DQPAVVAYPAADHLRPALTADNIRARACQPGPLRLLFVGNVIPRKGLHALLSALAKLRACSNDFSRWPLTTDPTGALRRVVTTNQADEWHLFIVGSLTLDAAYASATRRQIERDGLSANVTLRGSLSNAELAAEFARSHVLVVPSSYEGFGIVYLEGMAFGLPAI
ncbi:MAG: glycosyltransferase, partial [Chloroflexota bacterium]